MNKLVAANLSTALTIALLSGCSMRAPENLAEVKTAPTTTQQAGTAAVVGESAISQEAEQALSEGCVAAWRKELHGDESGAMAQLRDLDKRYPKAITVRFMMGQVEEHAGKKSEALKYYREAVEKSEFNSMYLFKLAESERTTGNVKASIAQFRKLTQINPDFAPAHAGLARALYTADPKSPEAGVELQKALTLDPQDKDAIELKKEMAAK